MESPHRPRNIDQLNALLKGELSAVETYAQCIEAMRDEKVVSQLQVLRSSHQHRVELLTRRVMDLGGTPKMSSGLWGTVARVLGAGAPTISSKLAVETLAEGEQQSVELYRDGVGKLSILERKFVEDVLVPEQEKSREMLEDLNEMLAKSGRHEPN